MFFSVKSAVKIAGKTYTPCICYTAPDYLKATVDKMVAEGKAYIYDHKVAFQNGKVIEKKAENKCEVCDNNLGKGVCSGNSENGMVDTTGELKCFEKKGKKKEKAVPQNDTVEDIPSPEEIAEDF